MLQNSLIIFSTVIVGGILFLPRVANNSYWRATITPLASIIGSGFLILGPILNQAYGGYAPLAMLVLCIVAFLFGSAIRSNIASRIEPKNAKAFANLETLSSWILAFAYIISVAYYLNLFGAFAIRLVSEADPTNAKILTTCIFLLILLVGWFKGFSALERMEQISVSLKLAIISGLIVGLAYFAGEYAIAGQLVFNPAPEQGWAALTLAFGLIITIQGFETSRYLGDEYDAPTRISSMRFAQFISSIIYVVYIALIAYIFRTDDFSFSETAIIDMMKVVAPILPALLIAAALSAQFSAAIADTEGAGGIISELTNGRIKTRYAYAILVCAGLALTWSANIFELISYASRAFALYYGLQAAIAAFLASKQPKNEMKMIGFGLLALLGICIAVFGTSVEV